jgi:hypothetical protein
MAAGIAALALIGCGGGGGTSKPQTATSAVTPQAGGTVELPDNSARIEIPAGAVTSETMITVSTSTAAAPSGITVDGQILKFEPDGLVFTKPVTVTFAIKSATHPTVYWSNSTGGFDAIGGTVTGSSIAAEIMHFSSGFVGDVTGGSADCSPGMACGAGATCNYGGANTNTGPLNGGTDPGTTSKDGTGSGSSSPMSGSTTLDPGAVAPKTSALSSDTGAAMCCTCEGGKYICVTCGSVAKDGACAEGASCGMTGSTCAMGTPISGGSDAGNSPIGGSTSDPPASGGPLVPDTSPRTSALSTEPTCCACGADGVFHCGVACPRNTTGPIGGGTAGASGGFDSADGGAPAPTADGGPGGTKPPIDPGTNPGGLGGSCVQGAVCQPGSGGCGDATPTSCTKCQCGADGHLACMPCPTGAAGTGGNIPPPPTTCEQGAACAPGSGGCGFGDVSSCTKCDCASDGHLVCQGRSARRPV